MEDPDQPPTKTSQPVPYRPQSRSPEDKAKLISAILSKLALHYWRPDFTPGQVNLLMGDYLEDLSGHEPHAVEFACRKYRLEVENKFFPRSAQILDLLRDKDPYRPCSLPTFDSREYLEAPRCTKTVAETLEKFGFAEQAQKWKNRHGQ